MKKSKSSPLSPPRLGTADLGLSLSKNDYQKRLPRLQGRLHQLQRACWEANLASLIIFEGWSTSGKGSAIRKLTERLEPRGFDLHVTTAPRTYELQLPWMWRFWVKLPNYGHMAIFDRAWYRRVLFERISGEASPPVWQQAFTDICNFESALVDDRYEVIKFFFHIDEKEQERRMKKLQKDRHTAWRIGPEDWKRHRSYNAFWDAAEEMLARTESPEAPWSIVEATDKKWSRVKVFETVIRRLEDRLEASGRPLPEVIPDSRASARATAMEVD